MEKNKEELLQIIGKPFLRPLGILQVMLLLLFISSPFFWIWHSWGLAWKLGITGLLGSIIVFGIYKFVSAIISETIDKEIEKRNPTPLNTSKFQNKLLGMQEKPNQTK